MKLIQFIKNKPLGLFLLTVLMMAPLVACAPSQDQMDKAVQTYLEKNPKVFEAQVDKILKAKGIRGRAPQKSIEDMIKNPVKMGVGKGPILGKEDAEITIVEFSDFQCPYCKRVVPTMKEVLKKNEGKVRLSFRHNPLPFHKRAMPASKAALAAGEQGKFWEMHDELFNNQKDLSDANILKIAKGLGLNMSEFKKDFKGTKFDAQIQEDMKIAKANGATGTPSFFVNGVFVRGARPAQYFQQVIDKIQAQKK